MRRKGDEGGKPDREQHREESTWVEKLKWGYRAGGTESEPGQGPAAAVGGQTSPKLQQKLHRYKQHTTDAQQINYCSKNQAYQTQLLILSIVLICTVLGSLSSMVCYHYVGFIEEHEKKKITIEIQEFGHKWVCRKSNSPKVSQASPYCRKFTANTLKFHLFSLTISLWLSCVVFIFIIS